MTDQRTKRTLQWVRAALLIPIMAGWAWFVHRGIEFTGSPYLFPLSGFALLCLIDRRGAARQQPPNRQRMR